MKVAILIDAGFLKRKLTSRNALLDVSIVLAFLDRATQTGRANAELIKDLSANIHQKGVDMRLGLDIAALTLKAHVDTIVLVAADSDFVPAMKFARREGAQVLLVTLGHTVRPDMLEHSDRLLEIAIPAPAASCIAA